MTTEHQHKAASLHNETEHHSHERHHPQLAKHIQVKFDTTEQPQQSTSISTEEISDFDVTSVQDLINLAEEHWHQTLKHKHASEAIDLWKKALKQAVHFNEKQNILKVSKRLAEIYWHGIKIPAPNAEEAIQFLSTAANEGDAQSQYQLARIYLGDIKCADGSNNDFINFAKGYKLLGQAILQKFGPAIDLGIAKGIMLKAAV